MSPDVHEISNEYSAFAGNEDKIINNHPAPDGYQFPVAQFGRRINLRVHSDLHENLLAFLFGDNFVGVVIFKFSTRYFMIGNYVLGEIVAD